MELFLIIHVASGSSSCNPSISRWNAREHQKYVRPGVQLPCNVEERTAGTHAWLCKPHSRIKLYSITVKEPAPKPQCTAHDTHLPQEKKERVDQKYT